MQRKRAILNAQRVREKITCSIGVRAACAHLARKSH